MELKPTNKNLQILRTCSLKLYILTENNKNPFCTCYSNQVSIKVKVVLYTLYIGERLLEDTYPEASACEVGWAGPFLTTFISPVFPLSTHLLLGEQ